VWSPLLQERLCSASRRTARPRRCVSHLADGGRIHHRQPLLIRAAVHPPWQTVIHQASRGLSTKPSSLVHNVHRGGGGHRFGSGCQRLETPLLAGTIHINTQKQLPTHYPRKKREKRPRAVVAVGRREERVIRENTVCDPRILGSEVGAPLVV